MPDTLRKIMVDGLSVETTDAGAQAIEKLTGIIAAKDTALASKDADHAKAIAAKDAAIAKVEAERDDLKAKVLSDADIDAKVAARAELVGKAKMIADADYSGKADADIRKAAVIAKLGDEAVKDKSDAYIEARFDILADAAKPGDAVKVHLAGGPTIVGDMAKVHADFAKGIADAWKNPTGKKEG